VQKWKCEGSFAMAVLLVSVMCQRAHGSPLDDLVAGAKKEAVLELYAPSTLTPEGAQRLGDAFNKQYHLSIRLNFTPAGSMTRDVGKIVGFAAAGQPQEWDVMLIHDAGHATLWLKKLHKPYDYSKVGVAPQAIQYDGGTVILANQFALPAYNKQLVAAKDVPKSWQDLLDPKWKGGKLGMSTATHHIARLATVWGEAKTTEFVKALAAQQPILGPLGTIYSRMQIGEVLVAVTLTDSFIHQAKQSGAPIVHAEEVAPLISPAYNAGVIKGAVHPHVGHLFSAFLTTPPAQQILEKFGGHTSALVPGTPAHKFVQGRQTIYMKQEHAEMVDRLTAVYGKIFGLQ
jgi:ABC-type Fe3+ transport system substrate-binding protein